MGDTRVRALTFFPAPGTETMAVETSQDMSTAPMFRPVLPPAGRSVVLCTPQMAPRTSFLSRQPDVIASFSLSKPLRPLVS